MDAQGDFAAEGTAFEAGDILFGKLRPYLAKAWLADRDGEAVGDFHVLRCQAGVYSSFIQRFLLTREAISLMDGSTYGAKMPRVSWEFMGSLPVALPHAGEQQIIADFLDRETAKIDALVAEQQHLLRLLREEQQARITHSITTGLASSVVQKPSGVAWLGGMPTHWTVTPLMRLTDPKRPVMYGIVLPGPDVEEGIPIVKGGNVKPARLNLHSLARTTPEIEAPYARARLRRGDLVYSIRGSIGDCEIVPPELEGANITQDVARVAPGPCVDAAWLRFALLAKPVQEALACNSLGAAVRGINIFDLKRVRIPTPSEHEQRTIAVRLGSDLEAVEALKAEVIGAIALLRERRTALISAAVTGKIDVRGLVDAALPTEAVAA